MRIVIVDVCNPFEEVVASLGVQRTFRSIHHGIILKNYFVRSYMRNTVFFLLESEYPTTRRVPHFAGRRVRMTDVAVELIDRQPSRVI